MHHRRSSSGPSPSGTLLRPAPGQENIKLTETPKAPKDIAEHFSEFLAKQESTTRPGFPYPSTTRDQSLSNPLTPPGGSVKGPGQKNGGGEQLKPVDYENEFDAPAKYWEPIALREGELSLIEVRAPAYLWLYPDV
jgi:hypothetical protein